MPYTPPGSTAIHFDFIDVQWCILAFNFVDLYSPPAWNALDFDFTTVLFPLDFEFAPEIPEPISKEMLLSLGVRLHGQVYKYWVCYVRKGTQCVRRYWEGAVDNTSHLSSYKIKFAAGVKAWKNLSTSDKLKWRLIGVLKKKPITSINAFVSAWMRDKIK